MYTICLMRSSTLLLTIAIISAAAENALKLLVAVNKPDQISKQISNRTTNNTTDDVRNVYINKHFVADDIHEATDEQFTQNEPLYELLQKQMEHVLAAATPIEPLHTIDRAVVDNSYEMKRQRPLNKYILESIHDDRSEEYADIDLDNEPDENEQISLVQNYGQLLHGAPQYIRPQTYGKKPTHIINTNKPQFKETSELSSTLVTPAALALPLAAQSTIKPHLNRTKNFGMQQQQRYINYKTISTGLQFVHTPLGKLMIKFSVGYAQPQEPPNAIPASDALNTYSSNLLKQLNSNLLVQKNDGVTKTKLLI